MFDDSYIWCKNYLNLSFNGVFLTPSFEGGGEEV